MRLGLIIIIKVLTNCFVYIFLKYFTWNMLTFDKGIAGSTRRTTAYWYMIKYVTHGILSTCSRTRIYAFVMNARFFTGAIRIKGTLRTTGSIWVSLIFRQTCANSIVALGILPTWRWIAWVIVFYRFNCRK